MLSILIPIYNYPVYPLCAELSGQAVRLGISFEIIAAEDGSVLFLDENRLVSGLSGCQYRVMSENRGRSSIRNFLAGQAMYDHLLFLDCDSGIQNPDFLRQYIHSLDQGDLICGDRLYAPKDFYPEQCRLNWIYGSSREPKPGQQDRLFLSPNFVVKRKVLDQVRFNPGIETNEDSLFGLDVERKGFRIAYIHNPVIHIGLNTNQQYLDKTRQIMRMSVLLGRTLSKAEARRFKMIRLGEGLRRFRLLKLFVWIDKKFGAVMYKKLCGNNPKLWMYDLFRLSYYCRLFDESERS